MPTKKKPSRTKSQPKNKGSKKNRRSSGGNPSRPSETNQMS